jgi:alkylation response protein AidB-like acyl-CoA dehydrogenase
MATYSVAEVATHNTENSCWIIIDRVVYDVTGFLKDHPGGKKVIMKVAGQDATKQFANFHDVQAVLAKYGPSLKIGTVGAASQPVPSAPAPKSEPGLPLPPFAEPVWSQGWHSPYYNESHKRFQIACRKFVEAELNHGDEWDKLKTIPVREIAQKAAKAGILQTVIGPPWDVQYSGSYIAGGVKPEEFDAFHELIFNYEVARTGSYVCAYAWNAGLSIGLPPVLVFGTKAQKDKFAIPCLKGEKFICLAITEPDAGSDVAKITTEAKLSPCGKFYIVNGSKKWITNGIYSDYFTTLVRTGTEGRGGVSVLVIERGPGVTTRQMECMGLTGSGTTFVTFEDVKVPVENLLGKENQGFKIIMHNFNHERMGTNMSAIAFSRVCYEEAFKYAIKRETFGKKLIDHPVIRAKLANMIKKIESTHAHLELVQYQLKKMSHQEAQEKLGGITALLKSQSTETFEYCTRDASQIFGGLAYTKGGQGGKIERLFRDARVYTVFAGSEEIMLDLGVKQTLKQYSDSLQKHAKL